MEQVIFVTTPMSHELEKKARVQAAQLGISRAEFVRRAVEKYLSQISTATSNQAAGGGGQ